MLISVSTLSFPGPDIDRMAQLPEDLGVEIFYESGAESYWIEALTRIMTGRTGTFSIHAPYTGAAADLSAPCDEEALFACMTKPFALYHRFHGTGYVVHTNAPLPAKPGAAEAADRRARLGDRLDRLNELCRANGVLMLVENLGYGSGRHTLLSQAQFLDLFQQNPALNCLIDTGHAHIEGYNFMRLQQALGARIKAYHMHDNDGRADQHLRMTHGSIDWDAFFTGARAFTPDAHFILEYTSDAVDSLQDYLADVQRIRAEMEAR